MVFSIFFLVQVILHGEAIVKHPDIKAISFTGSTRAGERIASLAAPVFKKLSLELGGKKSSNHFFQIVTGIK
jgi:acyl-CoA reductase-like NAD-dependent aldehyde dehydrogenase